MPFPSRFPGKCSACGKDILRGQFINWSRKVRGKAYHWDCNRPDAIPPKDNTSNYTDVAQVDAPETKPEAIVEKAKPVHIPDAGGFLESMASALAPFIESKIAAKVDERTVRDIVAESKPLGEDAVKELILSTLADLTPQTIRVENVETGKVKDIESAHANLPTLLYLISKRHHIYLYGPPASGKSYAARQVAEALGLEYAELALNPQTPESRLLGYKDANGTYQETTFFRLYTQGGVFCIDELDNGSAALQTAINGGLANGHLGFPSGMANRHKDFVLVATGNTCGKGANPMFPERRPFDSAFLDRFTFLLWEYDEKLERSVTLSLNPKAENWLGWIRKTRVYCQKSYPRVLVSPRAAFKGAEYLTDSKMTPEQIADMVVFKGLDADSRRAILSACPLPEKQ